MYFVNYDRNVTLIVFQKEKRVIKLLIIQKAESKINHKLSWS